jgi:hypothetical protein
MGFPQQARTPQVARPRSAASGLVRRIAGPASHPLNGQSVLDVSIVFAMIVYGMLAMALRALIDWLTYRLALNQRQASIAVSAPAPPGAPVYEPGPVAAPPAAPPVQTSGPPT